MKLRWLILSFGIASLAACDSTGKKPALPEETEAAPDPVRVLLEAEDCEILGEKAEDGKASGHAFVRRQSGNYQPVFTCEIPASERPLGVWLRRKGGAVQVKTTGKAGQTESGWIHTEEEQFVWSSFGEIPPGERGRQLTAIGNNRENETVSIDCVLFSAEPPDDKDALLTPLPTVLIDTGKTIGGYRSSPGLWGVNLSSGGDPENSRECRLY